jgi:hypothetical protein
MSAYIVDDSTINQVVSYLAAHPEHNSTGLDLSTNAAQSVLGIGMFALNVNAVEQRYGKGQAKDFRTLNYQFVSTPATLEQASESLRSWIYQCSEGDVPETSKLYQVMDAINELLKPLAEAEADRVKAEQYKAVSAIKATAKDISLTDTAKMIRAALKQAFPNTKFSVRSSSYSGGCSIDAHWTDGPTSKQVKRILDRFEGAGFDGMTDCGFHCGERMLNGVLVDFPGAYVHGSRSLSDAFMLKVADRLAYDAGIATPKIGKYHQLEGDQVVPFQFFDSYLKDGETIDLESPNHILAHDSTRGEMFSTLLWRVCECISLDVEQPVDLPEYVDLNAIASTGRASFEQPMRKFSGHEELETARAIAEFEAAPVLTGKVQ